jgi:membrane protease YdiL (CAAX protease family)
MTGIDMPRERRLRALVTHHQVTIYFVATFAISWTGALAVAAPALMRGDPIPKMAGLMMFPIMLLGPCLTGVALTRIAGGASGLKELLTQMRRIRLGCWYAGLLIPPSLILIVLLFLKTCVSSAYAPNKFFIGIAFGVIAGFLEEIGWMGFAFRALSAQRSELSAAVLIGMLWGFWHLPVIDFLGTASPHGSYLIPYFLAFIAVMTAMRVLIAWLYANTKSVLLTQLMHVSSTGSLVALSPSAVTAQQEAMWYGIYAGILWVVVALLVLKDGVRLHVRRTASELREIC